MNHRIIKNIQFSRLAKAPYKQKEFNFRKISGAPEETFHVDVNDDRGNRIIFKMQRQGDNGRWKVINQDLPQWIYDTEPRLHELIEEELNNQAY